MRHSTEPFRIGWVEMLYFLMGVIILLLLGVIAKGQSTPGLKSISQIQQQVYREYRGVRLGMTATEVRAKLGEPVLKSDEQDFYVVTPNETTQIAYSTAQKVVMISTDYTGGVGAPDYRAVVGEGLLQRPDGSVFRMVRYDSERFWVSYNKSATGAPIVTITLGAIL